MEVICQILNLKNNQVLIVHTCMKCDIIFTPSKEMGWESNASSRSQVSEDRLQMDRVKRPVSSEYAGLYDTLFLKPLKLLFKSSWNIGLGEIGFYHPAFRSRIAAKMGNDDEVRWLQNGNSTATVSLVSAADIHQNTTVLCTSFDSSKTPLFPNLMLKQVGLGSGNLVNRH